MVCRIMFHSHAAAAFLYAVYNDWFVFDYLESEKMSWGRWHYLSSWNLHFNALFYTMSFAKDFRRCQGRRRSKNDCWAFLSMVLDVFFVSLAIPMAVMLYADLGRIAEPDRFHPTEERWLDYITYYASLVTVVIETVLVDHKYAHPWCNYGLLTVFLTVNTGWLAHAGHKYKYLPYPLMEQLSVFQKAKVLFISFCISYLPYKWGQTMHYLRWRLPRLWYDRI